MDKIVQFLTIDMQLSPHLREQIRVIFPDPMTQERVDSRDFAVNAEIKDLVMG